MIEITLGKIIFIMIKIRFQRRIIFLITIKSMFLARTNTQPAISTYFLSRIRFLIMIKSTFPCGKRVLIGFLSRFQIELDTMSAVQMGVLCFLVGLFKSSELVFY